MPSSEQRKPSLDYCPKWGDHHPSKITGYKHGVVVKGWFGRRWRICPACDFRERA